MSNLKKILVVGAGIAGPALCYWLRRFGFYPVLIEKSPSIRKGGQGLDIRGVAIDLVKKMGIYEEICKMRTTVLCGRHVDVTGKTLHEEKGELIGFRQNEDVEILRGDLIEILMNTIRNVPCHFNRSIQNIVENNQGVTIYFKNAQKEHNAQEHNQKEHNLKEHHAKEDYDLVIGADGIHSLIRSMAFDKTEYKLVNLGGMYISIFSVPNFLNLNHTEVQYENNEKLISVISDKDPKICQVGCMFRSQHILQNPQDKNEQMQFMRDTFQNFGWESEKILTLMSDSTDFYFDSVTQVKMQSWTKGRIALLGDSGYCASPLSGQGNNLALVGAYILAGELKKAKGNYQQAFHRYNETMRSFVLATQELGAWVSESFLVTEEVSKEIAEARTDKIMEKVQSVSNAITLPEY